jgi:hypothetical protein
MRSAAEEADAEAPRTPTIVYLDYCEAHKLIPKHVAPQCVGLRGWGGCVARARDKHGWSRVCYTRSRAGRWLNVAPIVISVSIHQSVDRYRTSVYAHEVFVAKEDNVKSIDISDRAMGSDQVCWVS